MDEESAPLSPALSKSLISDALEAVAESAEVSPTPLAVFPPVAPDVALSDFKVEEDELDKTSASVEFMPEFSSASLSAVSASGLFWKLAGLKKL